MPGFEIGNLEVGSDCALYAHPIPIYTARLIALTQPPLPNPTPSQRAGRMPMQRGFRTPQKLAVNESIASLPFVKGEIERGWLGQSDKPPAICTPLNPKRNKGA
ncbi:MAG: hypothetical protein NT023_10090 [Armatimonadetes bacterium]|nr:hypothetical protein [Armatimonadota bacterium]